MTDSVSCESCQAGSGPSDACARQSGAVCGHGQGGVRKAATGSSKFAWAAARFPRGERLLACRVGRLGASGGGTVAVAAGGVRASLRSRRGGTACRGELFFVAFSLNFLAWTGNYIVARCCIACRASRTTMTTMTSVRRRQTAAKSSRRPLLRAQRPQRSRRAADVASASRMSRCCTMTRSWTSRSYRVRTHFSNWSHHAPGPLSLSSLRLTVPRR